MLGAILRRIVDIRLNAFEIGMESILVSVIKDSRAMVTSARRMSSDATSSIIVANTPSVSLISKKEAIDANATNAE